METNKKNDDMNQNDFNKLMMQKMNRIETGLFGDEIAGVTGIVPKVKQHEKRLLVLERIVWSIGGAVTILGILWAVFTEFHKYIPNGN